MLRRKSLELMIVTPEKQSFQHVFTQGVPRPTRSKAIDILLFSIGRTLLGSGQWAVGTKLTILYFLANNVLSFAITFQL